MKYVRYSFKGLHIFCVKYVIYSFKGLHIFCVKYVRYSFKGLHIFCVSISNIIEELTSFLHLHNLQSVGD